MTLPMMKRRRGKLSTAARTARDITLARAALALVQTKLSRLPGVPEPKAKRRMPAVAAVTGGALAVGAGAFAFLRRSKQDRTDVPPAPPASFHESTGPTGPSNYDAAGPVANSSTHVPVPEAYETVGLDEAAEEAAAAAEAANIGGAVPEYSGTEGELTKDEAMRAVLEGGEGEAEGLEQAEADLALNAQPSDGMGDAERRINEAIEDADNPLAGEVGAGIDPNALLDDPQLLGSVDDIDEQDRH